MPDISRTRLLRVVVTTAAIAAGVVLTTAPGLTCSIVQPPTVSQAIESAEIEGHAVLGIYEQQHIAAPYPEEGLMSALDLP